MTPARGTRSARDASAASVREADQTNLSREPFRDLPPSASSPEFERACVLIDAEVTDRCAEIAKAVRADEVAPDRRYAFDWVVRKLQLSGGIAVAPNDLTRVVKGRLETAFALIGEAARAYPDFLRGRTSGSAFFRRPDVLQLWRRYFRNDNLAYFPINEVAAHAVDAHVSGSKLRVLELGGGLGSAAEALLDRCQARITSYRFTDQLLPFLKWGGQLLEERFPHAPLTIKRFDFDRPFAEQDVRAGEFDLCYAVNALHASRDLLACLGEIHRILASGGTLLIGEAFRPQPGDQVPIEFVFQLSQDFQCFKPEPDCRTTGGFLHHREWFTALARSGFTNLRTVPDLDAAIRAYPKYAMGAILVDRG